MTSVVRQLPLNDTREDILVTAERLFGEIGFQKTTIADIARDLNMSPANIYRYFSAKAEINETVGRQILLGFETAAKAAILCNVSASQNLRKVMTIFEGQNAHLFSANRNLYGLIAIAYGESWPIVRAHTEEIDKLLELVIAQGMAAGEFKSGDAGLSAIVIRSACVRYFDFRLVAECAHAHDPEPTVDHMMDFLLSALN